MRGGPNCSGDLKGKKLLDEISSAEIRLYEKVIRLDLTSINISEYNQRYLGGKRPRLNGVLQVYGRLLYLSLSNCKVPLKDFVLVDYGGGSGLLSFLAVEIGIGTVVYNDIYDVSCADAGHLSNVLGLKLDHIVCGDVDALVSYLNENSISINAITSFDTLEHIYDVESHFNYLGCLTDSKFLIVHASGANIANPYYVRSVKKAQTEAEYKKREKIWGHKERDTLQSYLEGRSQIISAYAPDLNSKQVDRLAHATRGLIQRDIEKCVDEFRRQGSISYHIDHSTNTCDPYTGNWCEHLMDFEWLEQVIKSEGFSAKILPGRYDACGSLFKKTVKFSLNIMIQILGQLGMFIAPYYIVYAEHSTVQDKSPTKLDGGR